MTEKEISSLEVQFIRNQYGLKGDDKNEDILKIFALFSTYTSAVIAKKANELRQKSKLTGEQSLKRISLLSLRPPRLS